MTNRAGTTGGGPGPSGGRRTLACLLAGGFLAILIAITIANVESTISDFAAAGIRETHAHVWIWEVTSVLAWLTVTPPIWMAVARIRPPRFGRWIGAITAMLGLPIASAWHVGIAIGLRHAAYATNGETYHFEGGLAHPYLYEFRKDIATYLQFVALAILAQWLLTRAGAPQPAATPPLPDAPSRTFIIADGTARHIVPIDAIEQVTAAGNYVEVSAEGRTLLHRATLAGIEAELGPAFVRIHRSRLVNRAFVRRVETDRSGDFTVELAGGTVLRGSRRYRMQL